MAEAATARHLGGRLIWLALSAAIIFVQLLPLDTVPRGWAGPDWLLVLTIVWVARRPEFAPAPLIAALFLLADLLFQRPPGLQAGLALIFTEMLRNRAAGLRQLPFPLEWAIVGIGILTIALLQRVVLAMTLTPQPGATLTLMQAASSTLVYPIIVFLAYIAFGISRPAPGEVDALGHRL